MKNRYLIKSILLLLLAGISCFARGQEQVHAGSETLGIAVFDVDATPPVGSDLTYQRMKNSCDLGPVSYTHLDVYKRQSISR